MRPAPCPAATGVLRSLLSVSAALGAALEGEFRAVSPGALFARRTSQNLVAEVEPAGEPRRTLCLVSHIDSSRSGLIFDPRVTPHLGGVSAAFGLAFAACGAEPLLSRSPAGRALSRAARVLLATAGGLLAEREIRGVDVAGANDNASGAAATAVLAAECAARPLRETRLVLLITGSEEANVIGSRAFLDAHDTSGWLFLNFDGVAAPAALHHLRREGGALRRWESDPGLRAVAERVSESRPDLALSGTERSSGLPYDSTPILARGWPGDHAVGAERLDPQLPLADRHRRADRRRGAGQGARGGQGDDRRDRSRRSRCLRPDESAADGRRTPAPQFRSDWL